MTSTLGSSAIFDRSLETRNCVQCDASAKLICPTDCVAPLKCQFYIPTTCNECPRAYCGVVNDLSTATATPTPAPVSSKPSAGAIAGGVIGGVIAIAVATYLVWRYCIKAKRQPIEHAESWDEDPHEATVAAEKAFAQRRTQRQSTHTVHSIASTVLTRASNIIQIAYIPGVTNRATPTSPTILVPPVPPIPIAVSQANTPNSTDDQHFFVLGDSRDSTYSALSGYTDRTSYARTSYAPRSSVASTIYGKNAVIVAPAQTGMRAKPEMVSVRSKNSAGSATPPVPSVDYDKYAALRAPSPTGSTFSVGSTFLNNAGASAATAMAARPQMIRVGSAQSKKTNVSKLRDSESSSSSPPRDSLRESQAGTLIEDSPTPSQGPFADPPEELHRVKSTTSLSAVIEEATRRASQRASASDPKGREKSPFGDEHETKD